MVGLLPSHRSLARHPILGPALFLVWMAFGIVLLTAWIGGAYGPVRSYTLAASDMRHDKGCAYIAQVEKRPLGWPFLEFAGDSPGNQASRLLLTVDGLPVPNGHAPHKVIALAGAAGYSYWGKQIWFSAGDCSDPRTNGRRYEASVPLSPSPLAYGLVLMAWIYFGRALTRQCASDFSASTLCRVLRASADLLFTPVDLIKRPRLAAGVAIAVVLSAWGFLWWIWSTGTSASYAVAGFFPFSDASGWWLCSNSLLDNGHFGYPMTAGRWCQQRATYPISLAGLNLFSGGHLSYVLTLQATIVAAAVFVFVRRLSGHIPGIATIACAAMLLTFASAYAFARTMTENAGLVFGCLALALLLSAAERRSLLWALAGSAMMAIALNARTGAFFVLPALVLWSGVVAHYSKRRVWLWIVATVVACLIGLALQPLLVLAVGGDTAGSYGNLSYILYGLSVGGAGWQQVTIDHPEVLALAAGTRRSQAIYALALENLKAEPALIVTGLYKTLSLYVTQGSFAYDLLGPLGPLARFLWWLAWLPMLLRLRDPRHLLVALLSVGIAASAPLTIDVGGPRAFAATVAVDAAQITIGIAALVAAGVAVVTWLRGTRSGAFIPSPAEPSKRERPALETTGALLALTVLALPFTPLARLAAQQPVTFSGCGDGQDAIATRINRGGNVTVSIVEEGQPASFLRSEVARDELVRVARNTSTWRKSDLPFFSGKSLFLTYQLRADAPIRPGWYFGYADIDLARYDGKLVGLCMQSRETQSMYTHPLRKLLSVSELETRP